LNQWNLFALAEKGFEKMRADFTKIPNISFDLAVVKKSRQVVMLPLTAD
jgi:mannose-1-phosphate guanylyltransferase